MAHLIDQQDLGVHCNQLPHILQREAMSDYHLSFAERHYIEVERKQSKSMTNLAQALNRAQSTISRELQRSTGQQGYRHQQADRLVVFIKENGRILIANLDSRKPDVISCTFLNHS